MTSRPCKIFKPACFIQWPKVLKWLDKIKVVHTLMALSHCHKPALWSKWPLASSLLQAIKTCRQACPPGYLMHFYKDESLKVWWITIQNWQSYSTFVESYSS